MEFLKDEFYNMLALDYYENREASVIYTHYEEELIEAEKRYREKPSEKKRVPAMVKLQAAFKDLKEDDGKEKVFSFLKECFLACKAMPELYDKALNPRIPGQMRKGKREISDILEVLWPYLEAVLLLDEKEKRYLQKKNKKCLLQTFVEKLALSFEHDPEKTFTALSKKKLLQKDKSLFALFDHLKKRAIDKSFRDFLYTEGYMVPPRPDTAEENNCYVYRRPEEKGRQNKPDKMVSLMSKILPRKGILSLSGDNLDEPENPEQTDAPNTVLAQRIKSLYRFLNKQFQGEEDLPFSLVLAIDPLTGVTLQLLGNRFTGLTDPVAFAVGNRHDDTGIYYDTTQSPIETGELFYAGEVEDAFKTARGVFRSLKEEARGSIEEQNEEFYFSLKAENKINLIHTFGTLINGGRITAGPDELEKRKEAREENRKETEAFIHEKSRWEKEGQKRR